METARTSERPALDTMADAVRAWVARNYGPSVVPVAVTIRLPNGDVITQPLPPPMLYVPAAYQPSPDEGPPKRDRNVSDDCLAEIVSILTSRKTAMTGRQILTALDRAGQTRSESVVKSTLAYFVKAGRLIRTDDGYDLPAD